MSNLPCDNFAIHSTAHISADSFLQAEAGFQIIIEAGVCLGAGCCLHALSGDIVLRAGTVIGSNVLIVGWCELGEGCVVGQGSTLFEVAIAAGQVVGQGTIAGLPDRTVTLLEPQANLLDEIDNLPDPWQEQPQTSSPKLPKDLKFPEKLPSHATPETSSLKEHTHELHSSVELPDITERSSFFTESHPRGSHPSEPNPIGLDLTEPYPTPETEQQTEQQVESQAPPLQSLAATSPRSGQTPTFTPPSPPSSEETRLINLININLINIDADTVDGDTWNDVRRNKPNLNPTPSLVAPAPIASSLTESPSEPENCEPENVADELKSNASTFQAHSDAEEIGTPQADSSQPDSQTEPATPQSQESSVVQRSGNPTVYGRDHVNQILGKLLNRNVPPSSTR